MIRNLFAVLGFLVIAGPVSQAQAPSRPTGPPPSGNGDVSGLVVAQEDSVPVARASVVVRSTRDSSLVTGAVAGENGSFRIQGLRPGTYYLRVSSIGFTPRSSEPFTITEAAPSANIGRLRLARFAVTLQTAEVTTERAEVVIAPDRNTYTAKAIAPAATNASEVLQATPSVEVDQDGKVSLRGNENVAVQINGRPSPLRGTQLGGYLRQLPASIVERIEVVPTPSAREDPEGMAGIINIVLKQNVDLGLSGGYTIGLSPSQRYNASGNLGYQVGKWTLFGTYGFNSDQRDIVGINDRERFTVPSLTEQDVAGESGNRGHNISTNVDYKFNDRDVLNVATALNVRRSTNESLSAYSEWSGTRSLLAEYWRLQDNRSKGYNLDNTFSFKRTFEPRKHELTTELRYNRNDNTDFTALWREPVDGGNGTERENGDTDALTNQLTAQLDYVRTLSPTTKMETGYKGTGRWLDQEYLLLKDDLGTNSWIRADRSNSFQFDEQVHAVYGQLSRTVGKFELQGGLRAEHASREFALASPDENYPYNYESLLPSGIVSYKPSEGRQYRLGYSRRIRRPGAWELNPFPSFFDAHNVFVGNPELNPEYTDAFELSYNRTGRLGFVQLSPFYRRTTDVIRFIIDTDAVVDGREVTQVTFENLATGTSWGTDLNGQLRKGPVSTILGFNIFKMVTEGGSETSLSSGAVTWTARLNSTITLSPALTLQGFYMYRAPMNVERGRFSKFQFANVSLRRKLNDRATATIRVVDPFNTQMFRVEAGDDNIWQITERRWSARAMFVSFQYNFGQAPRIRQPQPQAPEPQSGGFPGQ